jgi:hypothetical protein
MASRTAFEFEHDRPIDAGVVPRRAEDAGGQPRKARARDADSSERDKSDSVVPLPRPGNVRHTPQ